MLRVALLSAVVVLVGSVGCGDMPATNDGGTAGSGGTAGTGGTAGAGGTAGSGGATNDFDTVAKIQTFLTGKTLTMNGTNIPLFPNGYYEGTNFGAASQCYSETKIAATGGASLAFAVTTKVGTIKALDGGVLTNPDGGTSTVLVTGMCDRTAVLATLPVVNTTSVAVANVQGNGTCFDLDINYGSYTQQGRGAIVDGGSHVKMELFLNNQATNNRCSNGVPGTTGVMLQPSGVPTPYALPGNAVQTYVVQ